MEVLEFADAVSLHPGLNHTVIPGEAARLSPGRVVPVRLHADRYPATAVVVAEANALDWQRVPSAGFAERHYRRHPKSEVAAALDQAYPDGWGPRVTWLWFVVAGWGQNALGAASRSDVS